MEPLDKSKKSACITALHDGILRKKLEPKLPSYKTSLDNPAVLEQQMEVLNYHKSQLGKTALRNSSPKMRSIDTLQNPSSMIGNKVLPSKLSSKLQGDFSTDASTKCSAISDISSTTIGNHFSELPNLKSNEFSRGFEYDYPSPPSPVSSSYSELKRASEMPIKTSPPSLLNKDRDLSSLSYVERNYANESYFKPKLRSSSVYESIYEPINFRPPSEVSSNINYDLYKPIYSQGSSIDQINNSDSEMCIYANRNVLFNHQSNHHFLPNEAAMRNDNSVDGLSDYFSNNLDLRSDFGVCFKCKKSVIEENTGCSAMDKTYHISCFTCSQCHISLQGKPFYPVDGEPYCEADYLQTLEKCSVCLKPILERILRATGKPYHPMCFKCVICGNSLDGIPFTVDATNQIYCLSDFHKKFAPRCCVCKEPIMPAASKEETVRVVALDRSFHPECYKCEDCALLLTSDADGRGCYPLDNHILCKGCNAKRVQYITSEI